MKTPGFYTSSIDTLPHEEALDQAEMPHQAKRFASPLERRINSAIEPRLRILGSIMVLAILGGIILPQPAAGALEVSGAAAILGIIRYSRRRLRGLTAAFAVALLVWSVVAMFVNVDASWTVVATLVIVGAILDGRMLNQAENEEGWDD